MTCFKFFSDTNLDGFVQSIAQFQMETLVDLARSTVTVEFANDTVHDLADQWGGVVVP